MLGLGDCSIPAAQLTTQFMELPGLRLTLHQAARLLHIDRVTSEDVIGMLLDAAFLRRTPDGSVVRADQ
jgi:hypothetical protein